MNAITGLMSYWCMHEWQLLFFPTPLHWSPNGCTVHFPRLSPTPPFPFPQLSHPFPRGHPTPSWSALSTPRHHPVGIAPQNILSYLRIQSKLKWNWPIRFHSLGGSIRMEKALRDKCECQVCGATAKIGFHYGAVTCCKCKAFFRSKQVCNLLKKWKLGKVADKNP